MAVRSQLFVGRLPLDTRERDVEQLFEKYGRLLRCDVKYGKYGTGMAYAFVDYDDRRDAEDAVKYENGRELRGQTIVVEWARGPSFRTNADRDRNRPSFSNYNRSGGNTRAADCYRCRRPGHWARDCPEQERDRYQTRRYRSRSKSHDRRRRSGSKDLKKKDDKRDRSGSKSASRSRSRSRSHDGGRSQQRKRKSSSPPSQDKKRKEDPKENGDEDMRKGRSPSRSRSKSRSPSKEKGSGDERAKDRSRSKSR